MKTIRINKQGKPIKDTSFASGGILHNNADKTTAFVSKGEFVIPNRITREPETIDIEYEEIKNELPA